MDQEIRPCLNSYFIEGSYPKVIEQHWAGPLTETRERYLAHCAGYGARCATLLSLADELLIVAELMDIEPKRPFDYVASNNKISFAASQNANRPRRHIDADATLDKASLAWRRGDAGSLPSR